MWYFLCFCYLCFLYSLDSFLYFFNSCLNILAVSWLSYRYLRKHNLFLDARLSPKSLRLLLVVISKGSHQHRCTHRKRNLQVGSGLCGPLNLFSTLFFFTVTLWGMVPAVPKIVSLLHHHGVSSRKCLSSDLCYQLWHVTLFDNCMGAAVLWVPSRSWSLGRDLASFMPFCFPDGVGKHSLGDNKVPRWIETRSMNHGERIAIL